MILNAYDKNDGLALHYGTAHVACAVVSGNSWNGYFTKTRNGERINLRDDDLLSETNYYFNVPLSSSSSSSPPLPQSSSSSFQPSTDPFRYPLCLSFQHWSFPHGNLPPAWSETASSCHTMLTENNRSAVAPPTASGLTPAVLARDGGCLMTGSRDCLERAHLCPRSQSNWFEANGMDQYNKNMTLSGDSVTDDISNAIALRSDIHTLFDNGRFVIVPKASRWVAHFCGFTNTIGSLYHNTSLDIALDVSPQHLLVRFAWTVFPFIRKFMEMGVDRSVQLLVKEDGAFKEVVQTMNGNELRERRRSESPKKRKAASASVQDQVSTTRKRQRHCSHSPLRSHRVFSDSVPFDTQHTTAFKSAVSQWNSSTPTAFSASQMDTSQPAAEPQVDSFKKMVQEHLRRGRPSNPDLYCCDYRAAGAAAAAGIEGPKEFGGSHLCWECLGVEYRDENIEAGEEP